MKKNLILILTLLVVTVFVLTSCDGSGSSSDTESDENSVPATTYTDEGEVKVRIFKIGKADAILIRTHTHTMLIDAGDTDNADEILEYFAEKGIDTLDYLVITMFDNGHVGGAPAILGKMNVKNIIHADYVENSPVYEACMSALGQSKAEITPLTEVMDITLDDAALTLMPSDRESYTDYKDENASIIVTMKHGENSFLFASDAHAERLAELISSGMGTFTFLKVPDHGRVNSSSEAFIDAVKPQIAVITCSDKNIPSAEVVTALRNSGADVYLTSGGAVKLTSDGTVLTVVHGPQPE